MNHVYADVHVMSKSATPTKTVPKGRKPKAESVNDFCRLCKCPLKVKFGNFEKTSYVSSENLFKTSNKKDLNEKTLGALCVEFGISVHRNSELSERVCKSCARKIRNTNQLYTFISTSINLVNSKVEAEVKATDRIKRLLPTTVCSPERSPQARKVHVIRKAKDKTEYESALQYMNCGGDSIISDKVSFESSAAVQLNEVTSDI